MGPCADRTGAKANNHVAGACLFAHQGLKRVFTINNARVAVPMGDQSFDQIVTAGPGNWVFSGGKHFGNANDICFVKARAEIVEKRVKARVALWLVDRDHAAFGGLACSFQNSSDFNRMVAVVVNDRDAADFANFGKAPVHPFEAGKGRANFIRCHAQMA